MTAPVRSLSLLVDGERPTRTARSYADVVEELFREYGAVLPLHRIATVARQCAKDLACSPPAALPELLCRSARVRLDAMAAAAASIEVSQPSNQTFAAGRPH